MVFPKSFQNGREKKVRCLEVAEKVVEEINVSALLAVLLSGCVEENQSQVDSNTSSLLEARQGYGIPLSAFDSLPLPPEDFNEKVSLMQKGSFTGYFYFSEDYYLQPEFYTSFPQNALQYWKQEDATHYGAIGFGFYPSTQAIALKKGSIKRARFFLHSGYGIQTFQGIRIQAIEEQRSEIQVKVLEEEFVLSPSFPEFSNSWAKAVDVEITVPEDIESGTYELKFFVVAPAEENFEKWSSMYEKYFNASDAGAQIFHSMQIVVE